MVVLYSAVGVKESRFTSDRYQPQCREHPKLKHFMHLAIICMNGIY